MNRRSLLLLLGAGAVLGLSGAIDLYGIDEVPFYTRGEPREAVVVQGMLEGGSWLLPMRGAEELSPKPPFFHWLGATTSWLRGSVDELSTRLPSAILAITITLMVYALGANASRIRSGWLAAMSLALSFEWLRAARTARVDMTFSACITAALLLFAWMDRGGSTRLQRIAFYALLTAATLTKGPAGLILPLLVIAVYALLRPTPERREGLEIGARFSQLASTARELHALPGIAVVLAIVGAWYATAWAIGGQAFLDIHLWRENVFRVLDASRYQSGHSHGVGYLFGQFLLGAFPFSLFTPALAFWLWKQRPLDDTKRFLVVWFCVVFICFLVPDSKRGVYLLPLYPAGALLFGLVLGPGPEGSLPRRLAAWAWILGCALPALLGLTGLVLAAGLPLHEWIAAYTRPHEAAEVAVAVAALRENLLWLVAASGLALLGSTLAAYNAKDAHWLRASVPFVVAMLAVLGGLVAPVERAIAERRTFADFMPAVTKLVGDTPLAFGNDAFDYGALFYANRPIGRSAKARSEAAYLLISTPEKPSTAMSRELLLRSRGAGVRGRGGLSLIEPQPGSGDR